MTPLLVRGEMNDTGSSGTTEKGAPPKGLLSSINKASRYHKTGRYPAVSRSR